MKIRFFKIAQLELDSAVDYYNVERLDLGYEFLKEVFNTIDRITEYPQAWQPFYKDTRRCLVRRFPYGVIYKHLHREPYYWISRLTGK
jgi:hypothetical protein